jgi:hypothetical protein
MQIDPTAVAARNSAVPAHGADSSRPARYAELADRFASHGPAALHGELRRPTRDAPRTTRPEQTDG